RSVDRSRRPCLQGHPEHPGHLAVDVRPADVVAGDGARAGRRRESRQAGLRGHAEGQLEALARRHGRAWRDLPQLPGVRVHFVRARRPHDPHEPVRLIVLHAHRLPRRARDGRRALAADAALDRHQARADAQGRDPGGHLRAVLALRRCRLDRDLHARLPHQVETGHMDDHAPIAEHEHPTWKQYKWVALWLTLITVCEVWIYYTSFATTRFFVPTLLVLSATKFAIVVLFYMHLKYDHKVFRVLFTGPLIIAMCTLVAFFALFSHLAVPE